MRYKFNPYERAVGLFLTFTVAGSVLVGIGVAIKKNWFEDVVSFSTFVPTASSLRQGSAVHMAGLKVGWINKIELDPSHSVKVTFQVFKKYRDNITEGTKVEFVRPFIIGDKVLTLIKGKQGSKVLAEGEILPTHESLDLLDIISGTRAQSAISRLDKILENLDATLEIGRDIAFQVGDKRKLQKTMENLAFASAEVRKVLPHLTSRAPEASAQLMKTIDNLTVITTGLKEIQPEGSQKTIEFLNETVLTLQAMQKSFFLRSNVKEVKEEMASKAKKEAEARAPAGSNQD